MLGRLGLDELKEFIATIRHPVVITRGPLVVGVNDSWMTILGYRRDQVEGRPYLDFVPPEERTRLTERAEIRAQEPDRLPFSTMTSLALKADGSSTALHAQPTVIPTANGEPFVLNFLFVLPERDAEIEVAELLVATSTSVAKARTVIEVREFAVKRLGEAGYAAAFFHRDGTAIHPEAALPPLPVSMAMLEEAAREDRAVFGGPSDVMPIAVVIPIQRSTERELMTIAGPRLGSTLRSALKLFAQGVGSALDTAMVIADLERRNRELSATRAELVRHERLAALGEMAASVAHEVRNPVGVISNAMSTLRRRVGTDAQNGELLSIIAEECHRLERMVRDLLEFARPRAVSFTHEALSDIAEEAISAVASQPDPLLRSAKFEIEQEPRVPRVSIDRHLLRQALVNLLINAAQASPDGGAVVVRVSAELRGGDRLPCIAIVDQGIGIPEPIRKRLFDPFFTTRAQGSGLGLAVVKRIVDALHAEISVESAPGHGATFKLTFRH